MFSIVKKGILGYCLIIFILLLPSCSSKVSYSLDFDDEILLSRGYPQTVLDSLSVSVKKSLQADGSLTFSYALIAVYDSENEKYSEYYVSGDESVFIRDLENGILLNWVISETSDENIIDVKFSYEWQALPLLRGQDPVSVSWDEELYDMVTNSFFKADMYGNSKKYFVNSSENGYANASENSVSWYADLKGAGVDISELNGYGEFKLRKKTSETEKTVFYGMYVHGDSSSTSQIELNG